MASDISLTRSQRLALIDLGNNQRLSSRTQLRLSSGRRINSVVDDSVNYFKAKTLSDKSADFANLQNEISQSITHLEVTLEAVSAVEDLLGQMKGILEAARSQTAAERRLANTALATLGQQVSELINDASYGGANLINNTATGRTVKFGLRSSSRLQLQGLNLINASAASKRMFQFSQVFSANDDFHYTDGFLANSVMVGTSGMVATHLAQGLTAVGNNNSKVVMIQSAVDQLDDAITNVRGHAQTLGSNVAILQAREAYTESYVTLNTVGAEKYTLADLNEEGANLVALQTRQQLGIQALSVAGQQQRAILTLLQ